MLSNIAVILSTVVIALVFDFWIQFVQRKKSKGSTAKRPPLPKGYSDEFGNELESFDIRGERYDDKWEKP